jgi:hypothetical protein
LALSPIPEVEADEATGGLDILELEHRLHHLQVEAESPPPIGVACERCVAHGGELIASEIVDDDHRAAVRRFSGPRQAPE